MMRVERELLRSVPNSKVLEVRHWRKDWRIVPNFVTGMPHAESNFRCSYRIPPFCCSRVPGSAGPLLRVTPFWFFQLKPEVSPDARFHLLGSPERSPDEVHHNLLNPRQRFNLLLGVAHDLRA
jgi:hypothetical protein